MLREGSQASGGVGNLEYGHRTGADCWASLNIGGVATDLKKCT